MSLLDVKDTFYQFEHFFVLLSVMNHQGRKHSFEESNDYELYFIVDPLGLLVDKILHPFIQYFF